MSEGPDLLGTLKRMLAATPSGTYVAPPITRKMLADIITEIATLRVALQLTKLQQGNRDSGLADQLLVSPEE